MRTEVASLMTQIKQLSDELINSNKQKLSIGKEIEDLTRKYHLLAQNVEYEQNTLLSLSNNIAKIKDEIKSDLAIQDELNKIKNEYNLISTQVA